MGRWIDRLPLDTIAVASVGAAAVLLVAALAAAETTGAVRASSIAAAGCFLLLVAVGVYLYAWRLGAPGRSD